MRSSAPGATSKPPAHAFQIPLRRQVAARLLAGPHPVDRAEVVVGPGREVRRVALDEVHEPEERLAALAVEPEPDRRGRLARAVVGLRPVRLARPAQAVAQRGAVEVRLAPGADVAELVEAEAEARLDRDPEVGAERPGLVAVRAQDVGEEAVALGLEDLAAGERRALRQVEDPGRARQQAGEHRRVRWEGPAGRGVDALQRPPAARQVGDRRARAGRGAVRLEGVGARRVEDDEEDVGEHGPQLMSRRGRGRTRAPRR